MPNTRYLTKSRFKLASECPRKLYYYGHRDEYPDKKNEDDFLQALAEGGHQVGALAQCYFPGGVLVSPLDYDEAVAQTDSLLDRSEVTIYEAAIRHEPFFLRVDVLVKRGNRVDLIEVKAKSYDPSTTEFFATRDPTKLRSKWLPYLDDVAFQTWVTQEAHPEWEIHPYLMLVDKTREADVDGLHQLFRISRSGSRVEVDLTDEPTAERLGRHVLAKVDVTDEVEALIAGTARDQAKDPLNASPIALRASVYAGIYERDECTPVDPSRKCKSCEYRASVSELVEGKKDGFVQCWRGSLGDAFDPTKPHIFEIWNARKLDEWIEDSIHRMDDVSAADLNDRQKLQVDVTLGRRPGPEVIAPQLFAEMDAWEFPLHFVDFETIMPGIPFHAGMRPYQNLAFQFSCHHLGTDGEVTHDGWLATDAGEFPNWEFLMALRVSLGEHGTIFRFAEHENTILRHLRDQLRTECRPVPPKLAVDDYCDWIGSITTGGSRAMVDMCALVREHYYHARMKGSNSIKAVLPAVLTASTRLEETYNSPLTFGTNLIGETLWQRDAATGTVMDPYDLLPPLFDDVDPAAVEFLDRDDEIHHGGAAMTAWARMQFCEMSQDERNAIIGGLLRYCELDTLAMLMIYQHWGSCRP